jgi:hypothetical protein
MEINKITKDKNNKIYFFDITWNKYELENY